MRDDGADELADYGRGQGMRVGDEAAGEVVAKPGRKVGQELRDGLIVPGDDQRLRAAARAARQA